MNASPPEILDQLTSLLAAHRHALAKDGPLSLQRRMQALADLAQGVIRHGAALATAISEDFGHRSSDETRLADLFPVVSAARHAQKHLRKWARPSRRPIGMMFRPGTGRVVHQPLGVVGIVSPWNYPVQLTLSPLVSAIAAGNRVMIKPSELTPHTSALMSKILAEIFDQTEVSVVQGGQEVARAFSGLKFDHLLFTGSTRIGREVMSKAAENLVPVTLELGGKSPALLAPDFPIRKAAERIAVGKLFNAGQTCIAPDYVLVPRESEQAFAEAFAGAVNGLYPNLAANPDYTAIINTRHVQRLLALVRDARQQGADVQALGPDGRIELEGRKIAPTLLRGVPERAHIMQEEIFGPLLPIVPYDSLEEAYAYINARPRPLALYLFSRDAKIVQTTMERTVSGGVTINDTLLHCVQEELPFGGIGESGMGAYHGEAGFRTFSHAKSVFHQSRYNGSSLTRPPYGNRVTRLLSWILR